MLFVFSAAVLHQFLDRLKLVDLDADEKCALHLLVDQLHVSVTGADVLEANGGLSEQVVFAEIVIAHREFNKGQFGTIDHELEVLIPDGIETVVFDCSGLRFGLIAWNAINLDIYYFSAISKSIYFALLKKKDA
jgi:hypothetical protein